MKVKTLLLAQTDMAQLSRKAIFPYYMKKHSLNKIETEMRRRDQLAKARIDALNREKERLLNQNPQHGALFNHYMKALERNDFEVEQDILELVEAHYIPRVTIDRESAKIEKKTLEQLNQEIFKLDQSNGQIISNATEM